MIDADLLVKVGLSDISFVLGIKEETFLDRLHRAAAKAEEINKASLKNLTVTEIQREKINEAYELFEQRWTQTQKTPGIAAGITDHVWTFRELLTVKCYDDS